MRSMVIALPLAALVLAAAGCGGSSSSSAGDTTATVASVDTNGSTDTSAATDTSVSTDMTSTDTGATDTGATDTTSSTDTTASTDTGSTSSSGSAAAFAGCKKLIDLSGKYSQAIAAATSANGKTNFETIAKAYKAFAEEVPEEIRRRLPDARRGILELRRGLQGHRPLLGQDAGPGNARQARHRGQVARQPEADGCHGRDRGLGEEELQDGLAGASWPRRPDHAGASPREPGAVTAALEAVGDRRDEQRAGQHAREHDRQGNLEHHDPQ